MLASGRSRLQASRSVLPKQCSHTTQASNTFKAFYATVRGLRDVAPPEDEPDPAANDFILSILKANPSIRDTKSYLASFGPRALPTRQKTGIPPDLTLPPLPTTASRDVTQLQQTSPKPSPVISSILNPVYRRTALVKLQGPFTDRQLESVTRGMVYLEKLGLVSVIVVELDNWVRGEPGEKTAVLEETMRIVSALEKQGARARPVLQAAVRLGPKPNDTPPPEGGFDVPEAHTFPSDLVSIRSALRAGEIPVLPPIALDSFCRSVRIHSNDVIAALARGMVEAVGSSGAAGHKTGEPAAQSEEEVDLTPLRLMIINREGGIPSYARSGLPHLLVNLSGESEYIQETFHPSWKTTHPTALSNLSLARTCMAYMPPTSSAIMVSHRSPKSLIANLITNKPELSSSLPHALLQNNGKLTEHTPTILRRGSPVRVVRTLADLNKTKMKALLEQSFRRTLDEEAFYARLEKCMDFAIIAGDYAGAAIVTNESAPGHAQPIAYLDKFAVLPKHQGDGTVDFLWVALHDESYGLGLSFSVNPNGGKQGKGEGRDLVWRSRVDNPVNKWYFERSTGHMRMGDWVMFWCDAEKHLKTEEGRRGSAGLSYLESWETGRFATWADVVPKIPSSWK
ncbi:mitochondrial amino-acid acetyltransferase [Rickenella mellea]|uniref:Amino-acid acetyltransferase, mitochondrial n=1 Tax=Rickenella mellea TaxID=50990 RepID=A0A4Y7QKD4_9AGAM|nr:mitochondrial amino-acid acetyltransferase [Rickenella mellea]